MKKNIQEKARRLFKREYMRGQIDRSNGKYSLESLEKRYEQYLKDNPNVLSELDSLISKTIEARENEIVEKIKEMKIDFNPSAVKTAEDIINLIKK